MAIDTQRQLDGEVRDAGVVGRVRVLMDDHFQKKPQGPDDDLFNKS